MAPRYTPSPSSLPKITSYNGVATAGAGIAPTVAYGSLLANSTNQATIASFTVGASGGVFEIGGFFGVTAWTSGNVAVQVNYTDNRGNAQTFVTLFGRRSTDSSHTTALASTGEMMLDTVAFAAQGGSTITLKTSIGGAATGDFYAFVRQVN
jgi:hypothetical protein